MNILLWILQILLAIHTATGAVWKISNSEQVVPSLSAMPHVLWLGLGVIEIFCSLALILPLFKKSFGKYVPMAAAFIIFEMLLFTAFHLYSGDTNHGPVMYWLVVAAICSFIAYGRTKLKPIN